MRCGGNQSKSEALIVAVFGLAFPCRGRKRQPYWGCVVVFRFISLDLFKAKRKTASMSECVAENGHASFSHTGRSCLRCYLASRISKMVAKKPIAIASQGKSSSFIPYSFWSKLKFRGCCLACLGAKTEVFGVIFSVGILEGEGNGFACVTFGKTRRRAGEVDCRWRLHRKVNVYGANLFLW